MKKKLEKDKSPSLLAQTQSLLRRYDLRARKGLGQHFLIDDDILQKILDTAGLDRGDTVIEVGPGLGIMTAELARRAGRVIAVELDDKLADMLRNTLSSFDNIVVINGNILDTDIKDLLQQASRISGSYKVVANLPYYITSPVLRHFMEASVKPELMVLMVQKEVAEVVAAAPGKCSLLSISVQYYGKPSIVSYVPAGSFYPAPEVDSAILRVDVSPQPVLDVDESIFFRLVRAGFKAPRKQIANSLSQGLSIPRPEALLLLEKAALSPQRRAGTFTLDEWGQLYRAFIEVRD
jgi:16S rRNA (adenine1518-N6/adenine1519-N6)-dimethyltransferase